MILPSMGPTQNATGSSQPGRFLSVVLGTTSIALLADSVRRLAPLTVDPAAPLGIASYLPVSYWLGLTALLIAATVSIFRNNLTTSLGLFLLFGLGLYFQGIAPLVQANARLPEVYWPVSEVRHILATGHIDILEPLFLTTYRQWPGIHFLTATIVLVPDLPLQFVKFVPLAWVVFFMLTTWSIASRFGFSPSSRFLLVALGLASWWGPAAYMSKEIAMIFYLLLLFLLLDPRASLGQQIALVVLFSGLLIMHGLTTVVAILSAGAVSLFHRRHRALVPLFVAMAALWYLFAAATAFQAGFRISQGVPSDHDASAQGDVSAEDSSPQGLSPTFSRPFGRLRTLLDPAHYRAGAGATIPWVIRTVQLAYWILYAIFLAGSVARVVLGSLPSTEKQSLLCILVLLAGQLPLLGSFVEDIDVRLFFYGLVPVICAILLVWRNRWVLVSLLVVFSVLLPIARYTYEVPWGQVTTPELRGSEFLASKYSGDPKFFSQFNWGLAFVYHYNPSLVAGRSLSPNYYPGWPSDNESSEKLNLAPVGEVRFVVLSKQGSDAMMSSYGADPFSRWPETAQGTAASLIYDSGKYYRIYMNNKKSR